MLSSYYKTVSSRHANRALAIIAVVWLTGARALATSPAPLRLSFDLPEMRRYLAADVLTSLPAPTALGAERIEAFEDHESFAYIFAISATNDRPRAESAAPRDPLVLRRVFFIRPQTLVIDDQIDTSRESAVVWTLHAAGTPEASRTGVHGATTSDSFHCQSLLPNDVAWHVDNHGSTSLASHTIEPSSVPPSRWQRLVHVVDLAGDREAALPKYSLERQGGALRFELSEGSDDPSLRRITRLTLPDGPSSGRIEIVGHDQTALLPSRLLPAGVLQPDLNSAQRLLQWDLPYQIQGQAIWDTRHASTELRRMVESGQIKPCRTVEIGCGTGNDAIYLATKGFDVTAIDISPTALDMAARKASQAGVKVNWLFADVLHPPTLPRFDFAYDRGCYHEVRQHHAQQYVAALRKLTSDDALVLILAGNANKDNYWRFEGPPRVREQDIRTDFANDFRLLHLKEFRFDPAPPEREGALAWSIFLQAAGQNRRADAQPGGRPAD